MKIKFFVLAIFTIFVLGLLLLFSNTIKQDKTQENISVETSKKPESTPTAELNDMEYTEVEDGKVLWKIFARVAKYYLKEKKTILTNVKVQFFLDDGSVIYLTSKKGIIFAGVKNLELSGNVTVSLPENYILHTERVFYSNIRKEISSTTPLYISGPQVKGSIKSWKFEVNSMKGYGEGGVNLTLYTNLGN